MIVYPLSKPEERKLKCIVATLAIISGAMLIGIIGSSCAATKLASVEQEQEQEGPEVNAGDDSNVIVFSWQRAASYAGGGAVLPLLFMLNQILGSRRLKKALSRVINKIEEHETAADIKQAVSREGNWDKKPDAAERIIRRHVRRLQ